MSGYELAWLVVVAAGLIGGLCIWQLTRSFKWRGGRILLVLLAWVLFLLPAPIPDVAGGVAPAFVVAVFEALFQNHGQPRVSLNILGFGFVCVLLAGAVAYLRYRKARSASRQEQPTAESAN